MSEKPNTKFYFDEKIARVVFVDDVERKIYWFNATELRNHLYHHHHLYHLHLYHYPDLLQHHLLPIEEWLKDQGMTRVEDDMCLFAMRWL